MKTSSRRPNEAAFLKSDVQVNNIKRRIPNKKTVTQEESESKTHNLIAKEYKINQSLKAKEAVKATPTVSYVNQKHSLRTQQPKARRVKNIFDSPKQQANGRDSKQAHTSKKQQFWDSKTEQNLKNIL